MLKNKVAIVTGAGRGIGRAISLRLSKEGAKVVIAEIDKDAAMETQSKIKVQGGESIVCCIDVSEPEQVEYLVKETIRNYEKIDILVNNAGISKEVSFLEQNEDTWDKIIKVNLKSAFLCSKKVAEEMIKRHYGKIVNITSTNGLVAGANLSAYNTSKAGMILLTKSMAVELGPYNINVNAVAPGTIKTRLTEAGLSQEEVFKRCLENIPLRRVGKPEDVAAAVLFLVSDEASFITGTVLVTDGGQLAYKF